MVQAVGQEAGAHGADGDGHVHPGEEGALVGEERLGLHAHRHAPLQRLLCLGRPAQRREQAKTPVGPIPSAIIPTPLAPSALVGEEVGGVGREQRMLQLFHLRPLRGGMHAVGDVYDDVILHLRDAVLDAAQHLRPQGGLAPVGLVVVLGVGGGVVAEAAAVGGGPCAGGHVRLGGAGPSECHLRRVRQDDALPDRHVVEPVRHRLHEVGDEDGGAVDELGELVHLAHQPGLQQLVHPRRRRRVLLQRQLDLEDGVGEAGDLGAREGGRGVAAPPVLGGGGGPGLGILQHHRQVRVQADAHGGVEGDLVGGAHVLGAHDGLQLLGVDLLVNLREQPPQVREALRALPRRLRVRHGHLDGVVALQEGDDVLLLEGEALLDAHLPGPRVLVRLPLHKHCLRAARAVPAEADGDGVGALVEATMVELEAAVVKVGAVGQLRVPWQQVLPHLEDGEVLEDVVLDARDVLRLDPVLARRPHEVLRGALHLLRHLVAAEDGVDLGEGDEDVGEVPVDPALLVQARHVELAAGRRRQQLVVLLQDLVEPAVVQVHVFLQGEEVVADGAGGELQALHGVHVRLELFRRQLLQRGLQRVEHLVLLRQFHAGVLLDLLHLCLQLPEEVRLLNL
mmetsp:Transcript_2489/g.5161  ORF Transcript_2489/g.5161 Transcript_2489/m.5161 type:complete len:623 (-) Transcript_2489:309-2177(-)